MTLAQIMKLALCQLDEDPADISEYEDRFLMYANDGYHILLSEYFKPTETIRVITDEDGKASISGAGIIRVISAKDENEADVRFRVAEDGARIETARRDTQISLICEIEYPPMENLSETPRIPERTHSALVDYICYRYLMTGNLAKQNRAQAFRDSFYTGARRLRPQNHGSVTCMKNLYAASDIRNR